MENFEVVHLLFCELQQIIPFFTMLLFLAFKDHVIHGGMRVNKCPMDRLRDMLVVFLCIEIRLDNIVDNQAVFIIIC
jgi:hypothetical protein